jgi:transcriptional regulator with XRE-family HTH domain
VVNSKRSVLTRVYTKLYSRVNRVSTGKSIKKSSRALVPDVCLAVKRVRQAFTDSQQQFAQRLQVALMTVSRFELGKKLPRDPQILRRLQTLANEKGLAEEAALFGTTFEQTVQRYKPPAITFSGSELACSMALDVINEMLILRTADTLSPLEDAWLHRSLGDFWYAVRQEADAGWPGSPQKMATAAQALDSIREIRIGVFRRATQNVSADEDVNLLNHLQQRLLEASGNSSSLSVEEMLATLRAVKQDRIRKVMDETGELNEANQRAHKEASGLARTGRKEEATTSSQTTQEAASHQSEAKQKVEEQKPKQR